MGKKIEQGAPQRRYILSRAWIRVFMAMVTQGAYRRCAKAVCPGCYHGWPHAEGKTAHIAPGQDVLFECVAAEIWKLKV